jgi:hypothetical protein
MCTSNGGCALAVDPLHWRQALCARVLGTVKSYLSFTTSAAATRRSSCFCPRENPRVRSTGPLARPDKATCVGPQLQQRQPAHRCHRNYRGSAGGFKHVDARRPGRLLQPSSNENLGESLNGAGVLNNVKLSGASCHLN